MQETRASSLSRSAAEEKNGGGGGRWSCMELFRIVSIQVGNDRLMRNWRGDGT